MKKILKFAMMFAVTGTLSFGFASCSNDDDNNDNNGKGDQTSKFSDASYGTEAMKACDDIIAQLGVAMKAIEKSALTNEQKDELNKALANNVDNVIVPTYTNLANAAEKLQKALGDLSVDQIQQQNINDACEAFKEARAWWEKSEAFLGGAAQDFSIDPAIDSWPLNRDLLHSYFATGDYSEEALEDHSILGFHALEFVLFRNGEPRKVEELKGYDTYKGFTDVKGAAELKYANDVADKLVLYCYNLEVAWSENPDAKRLEVVENAGLDYLTNKGKSYGWNMKNAGNTRSTFSELEEAIDQVLNSDEGSAAAIANEVGGGKIGHPFKSGLIFYVESPYSYNSITDFQNNIRSIENVWYGNVNGASGNANYSLHSWFAKNDAKTGEAVENAIRNGIEKIGAMPAPFVKYVSTLWKVSFEDTPVSEIPE